MIGDAQIQKTANFSRRLAQVLFSVFCLATVLFFIFRFIPSDPIQVLVEKASPSISSKPIEIGRREALRDKLGLNQSLSRQLTVFYSQVITGQFGRSLWTGQSVGSLIWQRLGVSFVLALTALFCFTFVGMGWGFLQALLISPRVNSLLRCINTLGFCFPAFALASALFPMHPPLPAELLALFVYTTVTVPTLSSLIRDRLLQEETQPYARAAKARGLSRACLLRRHLLKPCLPTLLSLLPWWWSVYMGTSIVVEPLFRISGMGLLTFESFRNQDIPTLLGITFCAGLGRLFLGLVRDGLFVSFFTKTDRGFR